MGHQTRSARFVLLKENVRGFGPRERLLAQTLLAVLFLLFFAALAVAQPPKTNPRTGIGWPPCPPGHTVYNIVTATCDVAGTAANPAGTNGQLQQNIGGAFAGVGTNDAQNSLILNVNTQMNVRSFGAKGDCTTDDHNAIVAAMTAAATYKVGNSSAAVVYFPKPPGGCYLTSTIEYTGVPMLGQQAGDGTSVPSYGVVIKGKPGYDILHIPDPSVTAFTWNISWRIQDISFLVDDSIAATTTTVPSLLHRWPGRWFDGAAMTAGSAVLTATNSAAGCADVGEPIQINGAGPGGTNLVTTIASVDPCWSVANGGAGTWKVITLTAAASTTVSNAHGYISVLDLPVTKHIGNCSIAFDNIDANPADFISPSQQYGSNHPILRNVNFNSTNGAQTFGECGIYAQGAWNSFNTLDAEHVNWYSLEFGLVEAPSEINPIYSTGGDFQHWDFMQFFVLYYPWITYNGGESDMDHVQFTTNAGPQFLYSPNNFQDIPGWDITIREMESWNLPTDSRYGLRTEGWGFNIRGEMSISADAANQAWIGSLFTQIYGFTSPGQINIFGVDDVLYGALAQNVVVNKGRGNSANGYNNGAGYPNGTPAPTPNVLFPQKGVPNIAGGAEPDFVADGYLNTPYRHEDLFLWPQDILDGVSGVDTWSSIYQDDAASVSGGEILFKPLANLDVFWPWYYSNHVTHGALTIGQNFPAAKGTLYASLKCKTATSTTLRIQTTGGQGVSQAISCSTSTLQTYAVPFDFTSATGNIGIKNAGSAGQDFWLAWAYIQPTPIAPAVLVPAARKGTFVCTAGGTIAIANTNEAATSDVVISLNTAGGTITTAPAMKTVTAGTGFSVLCGASDTSTYNYTILN